MQAKNFLFPVWGDIAPRQSISLKMLTNIFLTFAVRCIIIIYNEEYFRANARTYFKGGSV